MAPRLVPALALPPVPVTIAVWALLSLAMLPRSADDLIVYVIPWFDHIATLGPVAAFAKPFSNYAPPYLYLLAAATPLHGLLAAMLVVKLIALLGTALLALATYRLLLALRAPEPARAAALLLLVPSVAMNSALLGQCDAFWAAACVMALVAALDRRHAAMLIWFGLALGFKLQAMLFAPMVLAILLNRRVPLRRWAMAPAATLATMLPAWVAGWPASDLATLWLRQTDSYAGLSLRAPNLWSVVQALPWVGTLPLTGLAATAAIGAAMAFIAYVSARPLHGRALVQAALLCMLLCAGLAPRMHDRYFFLADVLSVTLALGARDGEQSRVALLVQAGSMLALVAYRSAFEGAAALGAVPMIVATVLTARNLLIGEANADPLLARAR